MKHTLTEVETLDLIKRAQAGDIEARDRVIADNLGLSRLVSSMWKHSFFTPDDLNQIAQIGLIKAIATFKAGIVKFQSYAGKCMRSEIHNEVREHGEMVRRPTWIHVETKRYERLTQGMDYPPTDPESVASLMDLKVPAAAILMGPRLARNEAVDLSEISARMRSIDREEEIRDAKELANALLDGTPDLSGHGRRCVRFVFGIDEHAIDGKLSTGMNMKAVYQMKKTSLRKIQVYAQQRARAGL